MIKDIDTLKSTNALSFLQSRIYLTDM